jgi:hypothetical protein
MPTRSRPYSNARRVWSDSDLQALSDLVRNRTQIADICRTLGRTEAAVRHALIKMLFRGMMRYPTEDLLKFYHINPAFVPGYLVAEKYDLQHSDPAVGGDGSDGEDENFGDAICRVFARAFVGAIVAAAAASAIVCFSGSLPNVA